MSLNIKEDFKRHVNSHFLAGDENIRFIPNFTFNNSGSSSSISNSGGIKKIELMCRVNEIGPIEAGIDITMPLWLGILLKQRNMGRILIPNWMSVSNLKNVLSFEKDTKKASFSSDLPFRYIEISRLILSVEGNNNTSATSNDDGGSSSIIGENNDGNINQIRLLLEDIMSVRMDKIRRNIHTLSKSALSQDMTTPIIDVTNMGSIEIATLKTFITQTFRNHLYLSREEKTTTTSSVGENDNNDGIIKSSRRRSSSSSLLREGSSRYNSSSNNNNDDDNDLNVTKSTIADTTFDAEDSDIDDNDDESSSSIPQPPINTRVTTTKSRIRRFR